MVFSLFHGLLQGFFQNVYVHPIYDDVSIQ